MNKTCTTDRLKVYRPAISRGSHDESPLRCRRNRGCLLGLLAGLALPLAGQANPQGMSVVNGTVSATSMGPQLTISASHNAFINWQSFNIGAGETTTFQQPSAASVVWNRINAGNPSQIFGSLNANGVVVLMNQSGFFFGPNSVVNVAGLVASTSAAPPDFGSGGLWQFNGAPPTASIVNYGQINVAAGGSAFLIAEKIDNHGIIMAPDGNIGLYAGKEVLISERPDGRGLSAQVTLPSGSVDNTGKLVADAGTIAMHAQVVNQNGLLQANSVRQRNGVIELVASDVVNLGEASAIAANGGEGTGDGGRILIKSAGRFTDASGSTISLSGGTEGGNGGQVEVSAPSMSAIRSIIEGRAGLGGVGGQLIIDPTDIILSASGDGSAGTGDVNAGDPPDTLRLNINSAFVGFSQISLQATRDITLESAWNLEQSTGVSAVGSKLTLEAGRNVTINNGAGIVAGQNWSVELAAGRDFTSTTAVLPDAGSILFLGTGSLESREGSIRLLAGKDVLVNAGFVRTVAGGSIEVTAFSGNVNTGTKANGFTFVSGGVGYSVDPDLGGISTANGGNVSITAGRDIISLLPISGQRQNDAGAGAFGAAPGDVTLTAGGNVVGHYVVRNGTGKITAGANAGIREKSLALSLVSGGWEVNAAQDILLQEIRNPNGMFNNLGFSSSTTKHRFDYAPDAYARLVGGNSVQLLGGALPRNPGVSEQSIVAIYPPTLEITAGAGGVAVGSDLNLFPSPMGNLTVTTTDGGSMHGTKAGDLVKLTVSDSSRVQYTSEGDFGPDDHADLPVHLNDPYPVTLNISGNLEGILLSTPKETEINIGGDMINTRFQGQNLRLEDVTSINVTGSIINRNEFTSVGIAGSPDFTVFDRIYPPLPGSLGGLGRRFRYNEQTGQLTFQGRMTGEELQTLLNLQVMVLDPQYGLPILDRFGIPITTQGVFADAAALQNLHALTQDVPLNPDTGYLLGGPGGFNISAQNMDLGATRGIVSRGPADNSALARYSNTGADININLSGNLDMFSTTISSIAGGAIRISAGGAINAGSKDFVASGSIARGIFTATRSDVVVTARGNIEINGSRIAAYDGGNVTVLSLEGDVNAGTGGRGSVAVEKIYVDPETYEVKSYTPTIPGSGILATTFPRSPDPSFPNSPYTVGNIRVETPRGDIVASAGGIVQLSLNGVNANGGSVTLIAGSKHTDENGKEVIDYVGKIDAKGSGVIGGDVKLEATGEIEGLVFARQNIDISSRQSVNVTALAQGNVNVDAGGKISGTVIGVGSVNASGGSIDATLLSQNVSASGATSGQVGFAQASAAGSTSQAAQESEESARKTAASETVGEDEEEKKKRGTTPIALARSVGRVTVILPNTRAN